MLRKPGFARLSIDYNLQFISFFLMPVQKTVLQKTIRVLFFFFLVFASLYYAKPFLVPVCFAGLLAMLFLPLSRAFETWGINRGIAILICVVLLLLIISGIVSIITWQITDLTSDLGNIKEKVQLIIQQVEDYITQTFGISQQEQQQVIDEQSKNANGFISALGSTAMSFLVDFVLMLVYIFLFMFYRSHIKRFLLQIVPKKENNNTEEIIHNIEKVAQQYLTGLGLMIVCLWIMYSIGFSIVGLKNAFFFAILCGLLEIVPFVGNLTGNTLAVLMAITQGGGIGMVIGIVITYAIVQFLQTYFLEPLVVGAEVNINPLFTIVVLVVGELVWGIPGMVLAIPLLGIVKIVCDHIEALQPYGALIGSQRKKKRRGWLDKINLWHSRQK